MNCDVIIPVGPGHGQVVNEALKSIEMAVATSHGPFGEIRACVIDDTRGAMGRSAARNKGIGESKADWLFFLDADDLMSNWAFRLAEAFIESHDAIWGQIVECENYRLMPRYNFYPCDFQQLLQIDPYFTLQMGFFVRREVMPLFDETMNCGEDWKAYLDLWLTRRCVKISEPLMYNRRNRHSTGPRAADGREWRKVVTKLIDEAKAQWTRPCETTGCKNRLLGHDGHLYCDECRRIATGV